MDFAKNDFGGKLEKKNELFFDDFEQKGDFRCT